MELEPTCLDISSTGHAVEVGKDRLTFTYRGEGVLLVWGGLKEGEWNVG